MSIIIPNKAVETIVRAPVNIPMTKVRAVETRAATPANILMPAARNTIGASNKKPIMRHHTPWRTELEHGAALSKESHTMPCCCPQSILPSPPTYQSSPLPDLPQNRGNFCGLGLFCYPEFCFSVGHDQENDQHYQSNYYPYPGRNRGYPELNRLRPGAFVAVIIHHLHPPEVGPLT